MTTRIATLGLIVSLLLTGCGSTGPIPSVHGTPTVTKISTVTATPTVEEDAPGGWYPEPIGSGSCLAIGVQGTMDGTVEPCQTPPAK